MQKTLKSLASVSLLFLILIGGLHMSASFLLVQGANNPALLFIFQSFDLPFLLSALLYGSAKFSLLIDESTQKGLAALIACSGFSFVIFSLAVLINFTTPDAQLF